LAIAAVLTWSVETFLAEYVGRLKDGALSTDQKLLIKSITTTTFLSTLLLPLALLIAYLLKTGYDNNNNAFVMMNTILTSYWGWVILLLIGILVTLGRWFYWSSINNIGGGRADILYYLTIIMVPIFTIIFYSINLPGFEEIKGARYWCFWAALSLELIGVILITLYSKNSEKLIE
jgi:drug/metabolite transporter (DMT)-like permease